MTPNARFAFVFLIDDFVGSGFTLLREGGRWDGKLLRFWDDITSAEVLKTHLMKIGLFASTTMFPPTSGLTQYRTCKKGRVLLSAQIDGSGGWSSRTDHAAEDLAVNLRRIVRTSPSLCRSTTTTQSKRRI